MKTLTILAVLALLSCTNPAGAQQSVTLRKGQLQQAGWFKAPLNVQITDERPRVRDLRHADEAEQNFVIPIGPVPSSSSGGNQSVRMMSNHLTPSGFQTNISAQKNVRPLNQVKMGGLTPAAAPPRPVGSSRTPIAKQNVFTAPALASNKSTPVAATYGPSQSSLLPGSSQGSQSSFSKEVLARLRHGK
ncbi:hypothetical protein KBI23_12680 [bacterium]|nr:hypothetical protein [bacterium]MBP9807814.1 hypothetical protein [bacterium]